MSTPKNPLEEPDTKAYFAWKEMTRFCDDRTPQVKLGWDAACENKNRELAEKDSLIAGLREEVALLTHKVITCGVAASHPDANLTRTGAYADQWDSPQAESVRALRAQLDALISAGNAMRYGVWVNGENPLAAWDSAVLGAKGSS